MSYKILITISLILFAGFGIYKITTPSKKPVRIVSADIYKNKQITTEFTGEKGESLSLVNNQLQISTSGFETNQVRYFNANLNGKTIYFMIVKDGSGIYRAAANGCEVCFGARKGFRQEGESIICNNCGNKFSLNTLGVTKGGCNPGPISSNIKVKNNQLIINSSQLSQVENLF